MSSRRLKVAVVGASMSTDRGGHQRFAVRAHLPALQALPHLYEVAAICTTRMETATVAAAHFSVPHAFDDVRRMLRELPGIDVVCVSVRPTGQHEVIMAALEAGKHVYCEHPMGISTAQAAEIAGLAVRKGLRTVVGHEHHYEPAMLELADLMRQGYVGEPIHFDVAFFNGGLIVPQPREWLYQAEAGGHPAWRSGHSLERVTSALGDIRDVCADMSTYAPRGHADGALSAMNQTNNLSFLLRTRDNVMGSLQLSLTAWRGPGASFQVYGSEGMLLLREEDMDSKSTVKGDPRAGHLKLYGSRMRDAGKTPTMQAIQPSEKHTYVAGLDTGSTTFPVAQMWHALAEAINSGQECSPSFRDELKLHCVWDATEQSQRERCWTKVDYGPLKDL